MIQNYIFLDLCGYFRIISLWIINNYICGNDKTLILSGRFTIIFISFSYYCR